ncbi:MAG: hypothetical protein HYX92_07195 [Chloroflexi bacterium]|nr:hypothetical protein [Chloroflexota bacterium]
MAETDSLRQAVVESAHYWPELAGQGDPNTIDVYRLARLVEERIGAKLPDQPVNKEAGIEMVELVENKLIACSLIRQVSADKLAQRSLELSAGLATKRLQVSGATGAFLAALYAWHGCILMAKSLRASYVIAGGVAAYSLPMRVKAYDHLRTCWLAEEARGNGWVRYGASLARLLEQRRGNTVVDNWVPKDSPYWQ